VQPAKSVRNWRTDANIKRFAQILISAVITVGFAFLSPAKAEAPAPIVEPVVVKLTPKEFAKVQVIKQWNSSNEYDCLVELWRRESNWRAEALNKSSGAFGIAQFMPQTWVDYGYIYYKPTAAETQIVVGLRYITNRYKTPCNALSFHDKKNWY
jgi:hypothetical protein